MPFIDKDCGKNPLEKMPTVTKLVDLIITKLETLTIADSGHIQYLMAYRLIDRSHSMFHGNKYDVK